MERRGLARLSDGELLLAALGDSEAFGVFYDRNFATVLKYFASRTRDPHTAADLTAETFAQALRTCDRFDAERGDPIQWLFGIAAHLRAHYERRHSVKVRSLRKLGIPRLDLNDPSIERLEELMDSAPLVLRLSEGLRGLAPSVADAVTLRFFDGLSFAEVADRLGCSSGAARVRVSRGLAQLAKTIDA